MSVDKTDKEALGYFAIGGLIAIGIVVSVVLSVANYVVCAIGFLS